MGYLKQAIVPNKFRKLPETQFKRKHFVSHIKAGFFSLNFQVETLSNKSTAHQMNNVELNPKTNTFKKITHDLRQIIKLEEYAPSY